MAVDASMRKLNIPPRFMPYLEKHRIYELFHDLGNELAMECPLDPLTFLKQRLEDTETCRDRRLVIIIAPPFLDRIKLAQIIAKQAGFNILSRYLTCKNPTEYYNSSALAKKTLEFIKNSGKKDWILADFPDTATEAKELIKIGVLPTHVFSFLSEGENCVDESKENSTVHTLDTTPSLIFEYDNNLYRLKELYKSSLKIINMKDRSLEELASACAKLTLKMPTRKAPKLFRIVLIGPRGSRRRTLAKLLSKQFNLVHVGIEQLINAARVSETDDGDTLRYLDTHGYSYPNRIVFKLLTTRLSKDDCVNRGYVLTNYPTSVEDFVLLDSIETPPNRVIFLDIDGGECQEKLEDRVVNMHTGHLHSKKNDPCNPQTLTHPDDESCKVENEIRFYNERVDAMRAYCGESCFVLDARGPVNALLERAEGVLMGPSPATKPRTGKVPERLTDVCRLGSEPSRDSLQSFPRLSRTEVVPLIESAELLRRFSALKKTKVRITGSTSTDEGDLIMRELDAEFERSLMG